MEELEGHLKEEIRLREKAEKRLKFLMKKLEFIKGSRRLEGSEHLSSSEVSCLSSICTSTSKEEEEEEEEEETKEHGAVEADKTEKVASVEEDSSSKFKNVSSGEASVFASTSSHEEEPQAGNDFSSPRTSSIEEISMMEISEVEKEERNSWALVSMEIPMNKNKNREAKIEGRCVVEVLDEYRGGQWREREREIGRRRACDHKGIN